VVIYVHANCLQVHITLLPSSLCLTSYMQHTYYIVPLINPHHAMGRGL